MFFLLRCLFWLGLVFSHIAEQQGFKAAALLDQSPAMASAVAAGMGKEDLGGFGRIALEAARRQCRAEPEKCLALAARASRLAPQGVPANPAASRDTLSPGDRAPAWRLRPGVAPESDKHG